MRRVRLTADGDNRIEQEQDQDHHAPAGGETDDVLPGPPGEFPIGIGEELFEELDAPVKRVAAMDTFCAYHPSLEDAILPQTQDITAAVQHLIEY